MPPPLPANAALDAFMRDYAQRLRSNDAPPPDRAAWDLRRAELLRQLTVALGPNPAQDCPLEPRITNTLRRDGYRIELLVFQSRPGVWVTGSLYIPDNARRAPTVLCVHGHWGWARREPVVQSRCIGLAKLGFVVLSIDAFGAGERHPTPARGAYHGALTAGTLWPVGLTLVALQIYDNRRAVDYLLTRPEVDPANIGITGASGGGNQSMYAGVFDERLKAVVPVCSVGTYQSYLQVACCLCEVVPGALRFTEEGDVLGLIAPRALLVINASRDTVQFSPQQAAISLERARAIYRLYNRPTQIAHRVFDSPHDYNQPMREAMYGWMTLHLKGQGDGSPIPEPPHQTEPVDLLRAMPVERRPAGWLSIPELAAREGQALVRRVVGPVPTHREQWDAVATALRGELANALGPMPARPANPPAIVAGAIATEGGIPMRLQVRRPVAGGRMPACLLVHPDGLDAAIRSPLADEFIRESFSVWAADLRGWGQTRPIGDGSTQGTIDHNSTEHAVWIGRPLLGQWVYDVQLLLDVIAADPETDHRRLVVVGIGQASLVALAAAASAGGERIHALVCVGGLASLVSTGQPYPPGTRMGLLAPGLLHAGDVPHWAALLAPRRVVIADLPREPFAFTRAVFDLLGAGSRFVHLPDAQPAPIVNAATR